MLEILASSLLFIFLDSIYLNLMKGYFQNQIKSVQGSPIQLNLPAAFACYVFLIFGLNYFIIQKRKSVKDAFLLGVVIYAVYELTTLSLLKDWSILTVFMDTVWGGILFAMTTYLVYKLKKWL